MNRLSAVLREAARHKRKLVCVYLTLGYPSVSHTMKLIRRFEEAGVDFIELGFPFSDPMADGPVIQRASDYALRRGTQMSDAFRLVKELRRGGCQIPIIFFSYLNPILHCGLNQFPILLRQSGFDGVIIPDLPPEESNDFATTLRKRKINLVFLAAPTTPDERLRLIAKKSDGFIYYVSLRGVTGVRKSLDQDIGKRVAHLKRLAKKPVLVGFGVSSAEHVRKLVRAADGVIVGSAVIDCLAKNRFSIEKTTSFVKSLVRAARGSH